MNYEHLCMGCMGEKGDAQVCPLCGWVEGTPPELPVQLAPRTLLSEKYLLGRVLGQGGFGITYLAWDRLLNRKLAIKEYFPREICSRGRDDLSLQPLSQRSQHDYEYGLAKFVEEGRNLARFRDYPGIVSLLDFFEVNGTAYIVMAYMEGMTFKQYLEDQGGKITFDQALAILNPVMDALREVHRTGMLHRDISPDNIYLNQGGQVKILDFGATRYAMRDQSQNLTVMIKPGYAPLEQYSSGGKQGPWTDVYAMGATFYRALSGRAPSEAPDRLAQDNLVLPSRMNISIPPQSESALVKALAVHWQGRFQKMEDFQNSVIPIPKGLEEGTLVKTNGSSLNRVLLVAAVLLLLTTLAFSALWVSARNQLKSAKSSAPADSPDVSDLKKQVSDLTADRDKLQKELDALRNRGASQIKLAETPPAPKPKPTAQVIPPPAVEPPVPVPDTPPVRFTLAYFELYSSDKEGNAKGAPSDNFSSSSLQYVLCKLGGRNPLLNIKDLATTINVKFFTPGGALRRIVPANVRTAKTEAVWTSTAMWGNGAFQHGQWRVEIWYGTNLIDTKMFQVN
jgi:serine/threonine protein kinase